MDISHGSSMDSEKRKEFISVVTELTFLASSTDWDSEVLSLFTQLLSTYGDEYIDWRKIVKQIHSLKPKMEFVSLTYQMEWLFRGSNLSSEWKAVVRLFTQIISLVSSMDLDLQPKPESELNSVIKQIVSLFNTKPDSESVSELISLITQTMRLGISVEPDTDSELLSLIRQLVSIKPEPEPELTSLIIDIISSFRSLNWEPKRLFSLSPRSVVKLVQGKFRVMVEELEPSSESETEECNLRNIEFWKSPPGENRFYCRDCKGLYHEEYDKVLVEVKHPLHPKHSLKLVFGSTIFGMRKCYCCDKNLKSLFYYCSDCDYGVALDCVEKQPLSSIHHLKWHEHTLALFPRHTSLTCDLCALTDSSCPFYICPPCDFVAHQSCISLPRVIRISRHPHRISFTSSFEQRDWSCGVCRTKIHKNYGGYSCCKDGCSYAVHSRCATQSNVWDGIDLEGVPEEIEEELEPFVRISNGIIQHFSHQQHHLRLDENTDRDYDENKQCQVCITPIYFGNFYSCMTCDFILHEECACLSRKIHHPIHPHMLTLVGRDGDVVDYHNDQCSACAWICTGGFFYKCDKEECSAFKLHMQCATISEPLVHGSHMHPLFLTSKPGERRKCSLCKRRKMETFNCIVECNFALCFECATIPEKVRYKHDKHTLTLSYREETSTTAYWCEICEGNIDSKERFYTCDESCCVTLHIKCLIGKNLYMKPDSLWLYYDHEVWVLPNNQNMSRPICSRCKKRCPHNTVVERFRAVFCSLDCILGR